MRQQQGDQIRRALEQPVEPVIGFQIPPTDTSQPSTSRLGHSKPVLQGRPPCFHGFSSQAPAAGTSPSHHRLHRSPPPNRLIRPPQLRQTLGVVEIAPINSTPCRSPGHRRPPWLLFCWQQATAAHQPELPGKSAQLPLEAFGQVGQPLCMWCRRAPHDLQPCQRSGISPCAPPARLSSRQAR